MFISRNSSELKLEWFDDGVSFKKNLKIPFYKNSNITFCRPLENIKISIVKKFS